MFKSLILKRTSNTNNYVTLNAPRKLAVWIVYDQGNIIPIKFFKVFRHHQCIVFTHSELMAFDQPFQGSHLQQLKIIIRDFVNVISGFS